MEIRTKALFLAAAMAILAFAATAYAGADEYDPAGGDYSDIIKKVNSGNIDDLFKDTPDREDYQDEQELEKKYSQYLDEDLDETPPSTENVSQDIAKEQDQKDYYGHVGGKKKEIGPIPEETEQPIATMTPNATPPQEIVVTPNVTAQPTVNATPQITPTPVVNETQIPPVNVTNETVAPSPTPKTTLWENGGGCERNFNTKEGNWSNIIKHEVREAYVLKNYVMVYKFRQMDYLWEVGFLAKTNEGCVSTQVEILKSNSTGTIPLGDVAYFNVWIGPFGYSNTSISNPYVLFGPTGKFDPNENIVFWYYSNGYWIELDIQKMYTDSGKIFYRAMIPGSGSYAVSTEAVRREMADKKNETRQESGTAPNSGFECYPTGVSEADWNAAKSNLSANPNGPADNYSRSIYFCDLAKYYWYLYSIQNASANGTSFRNLQDFASPEVNDAQVFESSKTWFAEQEANISNQALEFGSPRQSFDGRYEYMMYLPNLWINKTSGNLNYADLIRYQDRVYIVWDDKRKTEIYSGNALSSWGIDPGRIRSVSADEFFSHPFTFPSTLGFKDGTLIKTRDNPEVSVISGNYRVILDQSDGDSVDGNALVVTYDEYHYLYNAKI